MPTLSRPETAPGIPRRLRRRRLPFLAAAVLLAGCASHEPAPLDPVEILAGLERVELPAEFPAASAEAPPAAGFDPADGLSPEEAAALAVTLQPALRTLRAEAGVAAAELVEAGLLPDPSLGWNAVDWLVGGTRDDVLTGFGLTVPLARPGEIPAREGIARERIEELRWRILEQEWRLRRDVHLAFYRVLGVREQIALSRSLEEIAARTHDFFARARAAGAATALQENLARIELEQIRLGIRKLEMEQVLVRQDLNRLIGLPPATLFPLQAEAGLFAPRGPAPDPAELTVLGVERRPDLKALLARYAQAEEALRLEFARQWPQHAAVARFEAARVQADSFRQDIEPRLVESLRLTRQALQRGEVTPVEILSSQRQVLNARRRDLEVRIELALARAVVDWATGEQLSTEKQ